MNEKKQEKIWKKKEKKKKGGGGGRRRTENKVDNVIGIGDMPLVFQWDQIIKTNEGWVCNVLC